MGNVPASPLASAAKAEDDVEFMHMTAALLFNQTFVAQKYSKLPKFDGTVFPDASGKKGSSGGDGPAAAADARGMDRQVMNLFTKEEGGGLLTVEKLPSLTATDGPAEAEQYGKIAMMQLRLLLRVHLAYVRQQREQCGGAAESVACLPPWVPSGEGRGRHAAAAAAAADEASAASSLAVGVCLAVAKGVGTANPAVFSALAAAVIDQLRAAGPLALAPRRSSSSGGGGSMLAHTLAAIVNFAHDAANGATGEVKGAALGMLLAVALSRGSVHDALWVVGELAHSDAGVGLPDAVLSMLADLRKPRPDLHQLSIPQPWVWANILTDFLANKNLLTLVFRPPQWACKHFAASAVHVVGPAVTGATSAAADASTRYVEGTLES